MPQGRLTAVRVGMRLSELSCHALTVSEGGVGPLMEAAGRSLDETIAQVFGELGRTLGPEIAEVTVDVGEILALREMAKVLSIHISPRPPSDVFHAIRLPEFVTRVVARNAHVRGGHDMRAHVLAPLDLDRLQEDLPAMLTGELRNVAITAVGSTANPEHEALVADVILAHDSGAKISISHDFYSNVFRDRDFTTVLNSALIDTGEYLVELLDTLRARHLPQARLSFMKNDGGRAPLSRLAVMPVHGLYPVWAARILGAAHLAQAHDGEIAVCHNDEVKVGLIRAGLPVSTTVMRRGREAHLASNAVIAEAYNTSHLDEFAISTVVAELAAGTETVSASTYGLAPTLTTGHDLALIGCAVAPLTAWVDRLETITDEADLQRVQRIAEADAAFVTVQSGASSERTTIAESNVFAMPYGHPGIVRIRVQATGESGQPDGKWPTDSAELPVPASECQ